jgi:hypothetical protein
MVLFFYGITAPILLFGAYFTMVFIDALLKTKNVIVSIMALFAVLIQFIGYGTGFLKSTVLLNFTSKKAQEVFPNLFF